jgi:hypothetical protein
VLKANLNLEINQLNILSSYSNQEVWWDQLIWDNVSPSVTIKLWLNEINFVWEWTNLNAYINTHYVLKWIWRIMYD